MYLWDFLGKDDMKNDMSLTFWNLTTTFKYALDILYMFCHKNDCVSKLGSVLLAQVKHFEKRISVENASLFVVRISLREQLIWKYIIIRMSSRFVVVEVTCMRMCVSASMKKNQSVLIPFYETRMNWATEKGNQIVFFPLPFSLSLSALKTHKKNFLFFYT